MKEKLSSKILEQKGVKQGQIKSSDHYRIYINPLRDMVDSAELGVWIGSIIVGQSACADDEFLMTDSQSKNAISLRYSRILWREISCYLWSRILRF